MAPNTTTQISTDNTRPRFGVANNLSHLPFRNPFVGLRPFEPNESLLFFGRSEQTVELLQQLHRTRLLAVVGSSGCGKSSLIRAGLIPKLKAGFLVEDRDVWLTVTMKPGTDPIGNLAESLVNEISSRQNGDATSLAKQIRTGGAQAILDHIKPALADSDANLLLLADQFEEVFSAGEEAADFISILLALAEQKALPIYVVLTMRSDFWDRCEEFYGLPEAMNRSLYMVPRLTRQQRQQAIEGPIRLFGASLTARLLDRVLNDAGDQSDQLPVMQHALMRTWDEWRKPSDEHQAKHTGEAIDVCCYEAVGTIKEALSRDAEAALAGMTPEQLNITERMFQALTDTDANNRRVRRRVYLSEIAAIADATPEQVRDIIKRFTDEDRSFLIARPRLNADNPQIDISHESLIRQWERMTEWVKAEADWRDCYKRFSHDAGIYEKSAKKEDLLQGSQLVSALDWKEQCVPNTIWARRYHSDLIPKEADYLFNRAIDFLEKSKSARDEEAIASRMRLRTRRKVTALSTLVIFGLATALLLLVLNLKRNQVLEAARLASDRLRQGAEQAYEEATNQLQVALKKSRQADSEISYAEVKRIEAEDKLKEAERQRLLAELNNQQTEQGRQQILQLLYAAEMSAAQDAITNKNPTKSYLLINDYLPPDSKSKLRDFYWYHLWHELHHESATFKGHESSVGSVAFAPDGKTLASASDDNTVKLWDARTGQNLATLKGHESSVLSVAFAPDGKTLASASLDKTVKLWDARTGQNLATLKGHEPSVLSVAFAPDGKTLASASDDKTVKLWDARTGQNLATLKGHESSVWSVAFAPDGKTLASASDDKTVKLWDARTGQNLATLKGHESSVRSVAFAPDGKTLASAGGDIDGRKNFAIRLWRAATEEDVARQRSR